MTKSPSFPCGRVGAAAVICALVLGACASPASHQGRRPDATRPSASTGTAPITTSPGTASPSAPPSPEATSQRLSSTVSAIAEPQVTFTGETVTTFAQVISSAPVPLAVALGRLR